ncbi:MAG: glucoamylase family protein [Paludibacter sp.]|nr:glucoamylase family protein [Paludibacter sp.]
MNNKRNILTTIVIIIFGTLIAETPKYVVPSGMKATAYPAHVELNWKNTQGFIYEIYCSTDNGKTFDLKNENCSDTYLDFFKKPVTTDKKIIYKIIPKGLSVKSIDAVKFEVTTMMKPASDDELLDMVQRYTTRYFYDFADPITGMARERSNDVNSNIVTTGGTGFGIMALIAGAERNYYSKENAYQTINKIVGFLEKTERFHGAWAHWYNAETGKVFSFSQFDDGGDLVETAFLTQGLLTARQYYLNGTESEKNLSNRITKLWETIDWEWYTQGKDSLYWHWSKNYGFKMNHRIKGFDETLITYILAASSPTHPIELSVYERCYTSSNYYLNGKSYYGIKLDLGMDYGGPLFFTHYSFLGLNPNGLTDENTNYFERNRAHALIHRAYAIDNPKKHSGYGANCWGFTSSDDPLVGYSSHHPGTTDDNGTVSPTAAVSSIVYTPKESMDVIRHFYFDKGKQLFGKYGFYDAYNPGLVEGQQVVRSYLAIDEGPIAVMIENYRSGLLWKLFMSNPEIKNGLKILNFYYKDKTDNK